MPAGAPREGATPPRHRRRTRHGRALPQERARGAFVKRANRPLPARNWAAQIESFVSSRFVFEPAGKQPVYSGRGRFILAGQTKQRAKFRGAISPAETAVVSERGRAARIG